MCLPCKTDFDNNNEHCGRSHMNCYQYLHSSLSGSLFNKIENSDYEQSLNTAAGSLVQHHLDAEPLILSSNLSPRSSKYQRRFVPVCPNNKVISSHNPYGSNINSISTTCIKNFRNSLKTPDIFYDTELRRKNIEDVNIALETIKSGSVSLDNLTQTPAKDVFFGSDNNLLTFLGSQIKDICYNNVNNVNLSINEEISEERSTSLKSHGKRKRFKKKASDMKPEELAHVRACNRNSARKSREKKRLRELALQHLCEKQILLLKAQENKIIDLEATVESLFKKFNLSSKDFKAPGNVGRFKESQCMKKVGVDREPFNHFKFEEHCNKKSEEKLKINNDNYQYNNAGNHEVASSNKTDKGITIETKVSINSDLQSDFVSLKDLQNNESYGSEGMGVYANKKPFDDNEMLDLLTSIYMPVSWIPFMD
ncbi:uncharacterized protein LOC135121035 [Zophobas morio]|uniref:uncharacterized protein LOC135121035 n=1 Tax=Zophobas morio TaxID=2755281 RepID=UPI0030834549